ncbi:unnamed protein product [Blepharisma stoltei]|uniref:RING-type domain-containing protein n=1 Tax=Blepharisma stoltei TaxID=1481888 RepID=A0AAU9J779_9CILI|nr:unnamed protein product [Blepharisma stoltei]
MGNNRSRLSDNPPSIQAPQARPNTFIPAYHKPLSSGIWESSGSGKTRRSAHIQSSNYSNCGLIEEAPKASNLYVNCPQCASLAYDGGLCKRVKCERCGIYFRRDDDENIREESPPPSSNFEEVFQECNNVPGSEEIGELVTITLGLFREGVPAEFMIGGKPNFPVIFGYYLGPYFQKRLRCLGIGDYFSYGDAKFKVLGAYPSFGLVKNQTVIFCFDILTEHPISRVQILPIRPSIINEEIYKSSLRPFFKRRPRHIHTGQYLYLNSMNFMVVQGQPIDGIVNPNTQFFFQGEPLDIIHTVSLTPLIEDLPSSYQRLSQSALIEEVLNSFIMPFVQGVRRVVTQDQIININGVGFMVTDCYPPRGVIDDFTQIVYDGSFGSRIPPSFEQILSLGSRGLTDQQMLALARQVVELEQVMRAMGQQQIQGASQDAIAMLPTHKIAVIPEDPEAAKCMVCLSEYGIGEEVKTLPCFHMFHTACVNEWLQRSTLCPLCKTPIDS